MNQLPKRQQEIFDFIKKEVKEKGFPPTIREIGEAVGLASSSTVQGHLARLEKKGLIMREPSKPRALTILHSEEENV
jgi:repressor LexA